jgi:predicted ATPase
VLLAAATAVAGWALAAKGRTEEGIAQIGEGLSAYHATGAAWSLPYFLGLQADALGKAGRTEEALGLVDDADARVATGAERWVAPELHRLRGELLLLQSRRDRTEAKACFEQALAIAREQGARLPELRAAISLARLSSQRRRAEAHDLLAPVYSWFTEGFETTHLKEANSLLDALA